MKCEPGGCNHETGRAGGTVITSEGQSHPGKGEGRGGTMGLEITFIHDLGKWLGNRIFKFSSDANIGGRQLPGRIDFRRILVS